MNAIGESVFHMKYLNNKVYATWIKDSHASIQIHILIIKFTFKGIITIQYENHTAVSPA